MMDHFRTEPNLGRYRELASGELSARERRIMLEFLASELASQRDVEVSKHCRTL